MLSPVAPAQDARDEVDALSRLMRLLRFRTKIFYSGRFCGEARYERSEAPAQFHFLLDGHLRVTDESTGVHFDVEAPGLVVFPSGNPHRLDADGACGVRMLCCHVLPIDAVSAALIHALPNPMRVDLRSSATFAALSQLIQIEATGDRPGREEALSLHLRGVVMEAVRVALSSGGVPTGVLPLLSDARLARAVAAFLDRPGAHWTIASLARTAGMSRSAFAATFVRIAGTTPQQFLSGVRFALAERLLAQGVAVKAVAGAVGYASASSLARSLRQARGRAGPPTTTPDP